jgi:hypothetical protein
MAINQALSTSSAHTTSLLRMPPSKALLGVVLITTALFQEEWFQTFRSGTLSAGGGYSHHKF